MTLTALAQPSTSVGGHAPTLQDLLPGLEGGAASPWCQRWTDHEMSWRHVSEGGFDQRRYFVEAIRESEAQLFCAEHHYAGTSFPAALRSYGLIETDTRRLVGAVVLGVPPSEKVLTTAFPTLEPYRESAVLARLTCLDSVPSNAESFFLARVFEQARQVGLRGLVSFADPQPRRDRGGRLVLPGHVGIVYQALGNATYTGRATPRTINLMPDGTVLNDRMLQKIRRQETGHAYAETRLLDAGARPRRNGEDPAAWLRVALDAAGVRKIRHRGLHRYLFSLGTPAERRRLPLGYEPVTYRPKQADPEAWRDSKALAERGAEER